MKQAQRKISTNIGPVYLVASDRGLQGIFWDKQIVAAMKVKSPYINSVLDLAETQLQEYLAGRRKKFDIPLDTQGTEFEKTVWRQLLKIPYGTTVSYKEIAKSVNNEKASRAVGTANGQNPICIIVPCHRVISSDGSLGGYSGGLEIKKILLALEENSKDQK